MLRAFRILGYDIRSTTFYRERCAARQSSLAEIAVTSMPGVLGIPQAIL
jgi:hypothetical protein